MTLNFYQYIDILNLEQEEISNYRQELFAVGKNLPKILEIIIQKIRIKSNLTLSQIASSLSITDTHLRRLRRGNSPIPLRILNHLSKNNENLRIKIKENIEYIASSKGVKIRIPKKITPLLIEILGRFSGDGSCGCYDNDYKWSFKEEEKSFVRKNIKDVYKIFDIEGKFIDYNTWAEHEIKSKALVLLFYQFFPGIKAEIKTYSGKPPCIIYNINWNLRKYYTTGLIDTEGSFSFYNHSYIFEIKMANPYFIREVECAFIEFGIPYIYKALRNNTIHRIRVFNKINLSLIKEIFKIKNKKHLRKFKSWKI